MIGVWVFYGHYGFYAWFFLLLSVLAGVGGLLARRLPWRYVHKVRLALWGAVLSITGVGMIFLTVHHSKPGPDPFSRALDLFVMVWVGTVLFTSLLWSWRARD